MVFSSYIFIFLFLPLLVICYYCVPAHCRRVRNGILLFFSLVFYGWGSGRYLLILLVSIFINWISGLLLSAADKTTSRKLVLAVAVAANCLLLGVFKYTDFIIANMNSLLSLQLPLRHIALPIGISFFTFQGMSYVIDVYRKKQIYLKNPLMVALYIALFPQLVAGPIVRFDSISRQLYERDETLKKVLEGAGRFVIGLVKKIILADTFGIVADEAFSSTHLSVSLAWLGAIAYTLQIYHDFSGYSDMAIGLGKIFGFDFCENFNYPYISASIKEFWRRWHISLSSWFRDYVYIPLGGSRCSKTRNFLNLSIVWFLTGLWHGASWNFILWGIYYLLWLMAEKYCRRLFSSKYFPKHLYTILVVIFGWVLFRAENLSAAWNYIGTMLGTGNAAFDLNMFVRLLLNYKFFWILGILASTPLFKDMVHSMAFRYGDSFCFAAVKHVILLLLFVLSVVYIIASSYNAFIYFQF